MQFYGLYFFGVYFYPIFMKSAGQFFSQNLHAMKPLLRRYHSFKELVPGLQDFTPYGNFQ